MKITFEGKLPVCRLPWVVSMRVDFFPFYENHPFANPCCTAYIENIFCVYNIPPTCEENKVPGDEKYPNPFLK